MSALEAQFLAGLIVIGISIPGFFTSPAITRGTWAQFLYGLALWILAIFGFSLLFHR